MQKYLALGVILFSANLMAENAPNAEQPKLQIGIFKQQNGQLEQLDTNKYSRSNQDLNLCWKTLDLPLKESQNSTEEVFRAPKGFKIEQNMGEVKFESEQNLHILNVKDAKVAEYNGGKYIQNCWQFNEQDPLGAYQVQVKVNDILYPLYEFELIK